MIAGDCSPAKLKDYATGTVTPATIALREMYFERERAQPVLLLLFEREEAYVKLAKKWLNEDKMSRHFGLFRHADNVILVDMTAGEGGIVHEMVHAFLASHFRACPLWFNEGLASLYEHVSFEVNPRIKGRVNGRIDALQTAIKEQTLRPLSEMMEDKHFYAGPHVELKYAQARYFAMYLQEKGLLTDFFHTLRKDVNKDPTGRSTLAQILAPATLEVTDSLWRTWVMGLEFDESEHTSK